MDLQRETTLASSGRDPFRMICRDSAIRVIELADGRRKGGRARNRPGCSRVESSNDDLDAFCLALMRQERIRILRGNGVV